MSSYHAARLLELTEQRQAVLHAAQHEDALYIQPEEPMSFFFSGWSEGGAAVPARAIRVLAGVGALLVADVATQETRLSAVGPRTTPGIEIAANSLYGFRSDSRLPVGLVLGGMPDPAEALAIDPLQANHSLPDGLTIPIPLGIRAALTE